MASTKIRNATKHDTDPFSWFNKLSHDEIRKMQTENQHPLLLFKWIEADVPITS